MTTTVTVKTHDWPVKMTTTDHMKTGFTGVSAVIPPNSERQVYLTSSRSLAFEELPIPEPESDDPNASLTTGYAKAG